MRILEKDGQLESVKDKCPHEKVQPTFDERTARDCSAKMVRKLWPRFDGTCPDCEQHLILYASTAHFIYGDW